MLKFTEYKKTPKEDKPLFENANTRFLKEVNGVKTYRNLVEKYGSDTSNFLDNVSKHYDEIIKDSKGPSKVRYLAEKEVVLRFFRKNIKEL